MSNADVYEKYETKLTLNPEYKIREVEVSTSWVNLHGRADKIQDKAGNWRKIREVKSGYKFTTFLDDAGDIIAKVDVGSKVLVQRTEKTKASQKAAERLRHNVKIADQIEAAQNSVEKAIADMQAEHESGHMLRYFHYDSIMLADAMSGLWKWVAEHAENENVLDLVASYKDVRKAVKKRMLGRYEHKALSRSTSVTSNLLEDVMMDVQAQFIEFLDRY